ncbi:MAG: L-serine ammonia-lyase, iron-sulfur-dependent, subunit alpha [Defluviitaleaceae bacterium]|nr:L-serine ammonia-lyase, iron-sulfur-dependent, subunit alpha [Defluviitaleaceae bacterium]MCL2274479.1 L-serine ammonia-lyase, iron-sulfur-dependent, subunit alpha [Defluviitaleaceae bacterium]
MQIDFSSVAQLIEAANTNNVAISRIVLQQSACDMQITEGEIFAKMASHLTIMCASVEEGLSPNTRSLSGLITNEAFLLKEYVDAGKSLSGQLLGSAVYNSLAVMATNACMGKVVAAPTAGSAGVIPGCLVALLGSLQIPEEVLINGLLNASGIGMVIARNASISGAVGGCQAECGSASAMAASALVEIKGGTPTMCGHAAALALKSLMGLVCDPVAGLVEVPCALRNAAATSVAIISADMALAGIKSVIPIDEVITAMGEVGKAIPEALRETSKGGLAVTPTAKKIEATLYS